MKKTIRPLAARDRTERVIGIGDRFDGRFTKFRPETLEFGRDSEAEPRDVKRLSRCPEISVYDVRAVSPVENVFKRKAAAGGQHNPAGARQVRPLFACDNCVEPMGLYARARSKRVELFAARLKEIF